MPYFTDYPADGGLFRRADAPVHSSGRARAPAQDAMRALFFFSTPRSLFRPQTDASSNLSKSRRQKSLGLNAWRIQAAVF